jgi:hypothetical protein
MSLNIWMQCEGSSKFCPFAGEVWRLVEAQHIISTRKLVDNLDEQKVLEYLLERSKPVITSTENFHFLLFTPFRYPPLKHGSRFGSRQERAIWYGSQAISTALAEVAYYRLLFFEGTQADLKDIQLELTAFSVNVKSNKAIDLTLPPFNLWLSEWMSKTTYSTTQEFGKQARDAGTEIIVYFSARDPEQGSNIAVISISAFAEKNPTHEQTWTCFVSRSKIEFYRKNVIASDEEIFIFDRLQFLVEGEFPHHAL